MLKRNIIIFSLLFVGVISCNQCPDCSTNKDYLKKEKNTANVMSIDNVKIFYLSTPASEYDVLDLCRNDIENQIAEETKDKKFLGKVLGVAKIAFKNTNSYDLLEQMVNSAKLKNSNVEGLIFEKNLSSCKMIKFK